MPETSSALSCHSPPHYDWSACEARYCAWVRDMSRRDFLKGVAAAAAAWPLAACDQSVRTFGRPNTYAIAFSPDGRTCLSGAGDGSLKLWNLATGEVMRDFFTGSLAALEADAGIRDAFLAV